MAAWCLTIVGTAKASRVNREEDTTCIIGEYREDTELTDIILTLDENATRVFPSPRIPSPSIPSLSQLHRDTPQTKTKYRFDSFPKGERAGEILKTERRFRPMMRQQQIWIASGANVPDRPAPSVDSE